MIRNENDKIYKYPLPMQDDSEIMMPRGATVLCVQVQKGMPCIWARVNTGREQVPRRFIVVGTGHPMPYAAGAYVGTFQVSDGQLVFHVFEDIRKFRE